MKVQCFLDRDLNEITEEKWKQLRLDRSYYMIREYMNDEWIIRAMWDGKLDYFAKTEVQAKAMRRPFHLAVMKAKPNENVSNVTLERYGTELGVIAAYEDFLVRRDLAKFVPMGIGDIRFLEVGNQLKQVDLRQVFDVAPNEVLPEEAGSW